jgi:HK97 family phage portal protein
MGIFTKAVSTIARGLGLQDPRLYQYFGGGETDAGENVSVDSSLQIGTVWACVRLISQTIATLPLHVFQTDRTGHGVIAPDHPLYRLLHDKPNADMTSVEFWEAVVAHILLWGNAFIGITRFGARIVALTPMRPDRVIVRREPDGALSYTYTWAGKSETYPEDEVLHIKGFSLDGYMGLSPIAMARQSLGAARAAERASASVFRNGMRPSGLLKAPDYLTAPQREDAKAILENFKGSINTGKVPLIEGGWDFQPMVIPPNDAQMLETRAFNVEELCRWFDVPPVMIGHMDKQSSWGTGVEQIMLHFYTSCLRAHLERIEQAIKGSLITPDDMKRGVYAEFSIEGLLRADSAGRASYYSTMVQNGMLTRNEARAYENLPRMPGGDDLTVQSNLIPVSDLGLIARMPREKPVEPGAAIVPPSPQNGSSAPIAEIKQ